MEMLHNMNQYDQTEKKILTQNNVHISVSWTFQFTSPK